MVPKKPSSSSSRAAATPTVAPSQLGLTNGEEIATFQRHQQVALSRANNNNARTAAANGRVLVDANSLMLLANYFDHVMAGIQQRADLVSNSLSDIPHFLRKHPGLVHLLFVCAAILRLVSGLSLFNCGRYDQTCSKSIY